MKHTISKEVEFDAGHRVPNHASKCRNPHGHRYRVRARVTGEIVTTSGASNEGMLEDFTVIKDLLNRFSHDIYDHGFIVWSEDMAMQVALAKGADRDNLNWNVIVVPWIPTAENLAKSIFEKFDEHLTKFQTSFQIQGIDVWETPTSIASYDRD